MKSLKKLLLIHWHYFVHETVEFDMINFLTGKNASGKSTIIDALQLVLLADTSGNSFNKAASGKNSRTLRGYLLGELGDDEDSGFKYLRKGRFSSYIALEFFDDEKDSSFTAGCCFDVYSENDYPRLFFRFNGRIPEHEFIDTALTGRKAMDIAALRAWIRERYAQSSYFTTDTNQSFQEDLYGKLGALQGRRFSQLLKRAVSFDPNVDIQKFISEFVCDTPQMVDVSGLQENIRSYTRLEEEEAILRERIGELDRIAASYGNFDAQRKNETLYSYLIEKAASDIKTAAIQNHRAEAVKFTEKIEKLAFSIDDANRRLEKMRDERDELRVQLMNNETARVVEHLEKQIRDKEDEIRIIREEFEAVSRRFQDMVSVWKSRLAFLSAEIAALPAGVFEAALAQRIRNLTEEAARFSSMLEGFNPAESACVRIAGDWEIKSRVAAANQVRTQSNNLSSRLCDEEDDLAQRRRSLEEEERSLKQGVYQFPREVQDLKEAIAGRIRLKSGGQGGVFIVAEAADIPGKRWRNVIEGYLNTRKFYLIVPPEHFDTALHVYDAIKRERNIYNTGVVDIEKIEKLGPRAEPGSLAEEITTENPWVRLFLDYTLGRVIKCDRVKELRNYKTSVTDEGMLYQNFTVQAMDPRRWARPAIGRGAILQLLEDIRRELENLGKRLAALGTLRKAVDPLGSLAVPGETESVQLVKAAFSMERVPRLEEEIDGLNKNLSAVDRSAILALEERIQTLDRTVKETDEEARTLISGKSVNEDRLRVLLETTIPKLEEELSALQDRIAENYSAEWVEAAGEPRYRKEFAERGGPAEIAGAFPRELSRSKNGREKFWDELRELRRIYNDRYKMGYDTGVENNDAWETVRLELGENRLPEYRAKIEDARAKAYEQFREDFLSRLQNNIHDARQQIDNLNAALSSSSFGEDSYRFRIVPKAEYKRYYDMIVDPMLLDGGYNLLSEHFNAKYRDEIAELFAIITSEGDGRRSEGRDDYEKRVQIFTDYRTYLSFDLEVTNSEGESQRLSRTMGKKSGGETQTPFYIAVLASFTQLYRIGRDRKAGTVRIIIFDEAFSKMDSERITSSIELLRKFNFQVILSAPSDKIGDIAPLSDRNLLVFRDKKNSSVVSFDPRKTLAGQEEGEPHAP
ncbi:MAG: AAA family ATPase [Treponema sp.]|nr:AAA family ATPase [Treponema sp.]